MLGALPAQRPAGDATPSLGGSAGLASAASVPQATWCPRIHPVHSLLPIPLHRSSISAGVSLSGLGDKAARSGKEVCATCGRRRTRCFVQLIVCLPSCRNASVSDGLSRLEANEGAARDTGAGGESFSVLAGTRFTAADSSARRRSGHHPRTLATRGQSPWNKQRWIVL